MTSADEKVFAKPWVEFTEEFGGAPLLHGPLDNIYRRWDQIFARVLALYEIPAPDTSVKTADIKISSEVTLRVYTPPQATGHDPLGVWIHGGGWALGSIDQEDPTCRVISKRCKMVLVSIGYRLAPKHKFPAALDDCVEGTKWALKNALSIGADDNGATLVGGSAGGGLAFGTALRLIDEGKGSQVNGVAAAVPVTVHPDAIPIKMKEAYTSYDEHAEHTVNTESGMREFFATYGAPIDDKYTSPLLHPRLQDLRKVYMAECGTDTLRDDARLMKKWLEKDGVKVKYDDYPGYPHYFWLYPSKLLLGPQEHFYNNLIGGIKWLLEPNRFL